MFTPPKPSSLRAQFFDARVAGFEIEFFGERQLACEIFSDWPSSVWQFS